MPTVSCLKASSDEKTLFISAFYELGAVTFCCERGGMYFRGQALHAFKLPLFAVEFTELSIRFPAQYS